MVLTPQKTSPHLVSATAGTHRHTAHTGRRPVGQAAYFALVAGQPQTVLSCNLLVHEAEQHSSTCHTALHSFNVNKYLTVY